MSKRPENNSDYSSLYRLTPMQIACLRLVAQGLSNPEIGRQLHITVPTVAHHLKGVHARLGVSDRTAAVVTALRHGILQLEPEGMPE